MDILIGAIGAVAGAAISLAGVFITNRHSERRAHRDAVGDFLAETYKQLSFHAPNQNFSEACGKVKQYVSPEQSRLVDRVMQHILSKASAEELSQTVPHVLDEFLNLDSVCAEHRKMFQASSR